MFGFIVLNGFCDNVFSDYLWARAVVLTSPTVATIGMSVTIPLAMASDFLLGKQAPTPVSLGGASLVVVGFVLVNIPSALQRDIVDAARTTWRTIGCCTTGSDEAEFMLRAHSGEERREKELGRYAPLAAQR